MNKLLIATAMLLGATAANAVPAVWETNYGTAIVGGDDVTTNGALSFAFPFFGNSYTDFEASTNGFVSLGGHNGSGCCSGNVGGLLSGAARIAPQWFDWVDTVYLNTAVAGRAVFTWSGFEYYDTRTAFTTQAQLFANGSIIFGFNGPSTIDNHMSLTGVSIGGGAGDPGGTDLTNANFTTGSGTSFYQLFNSGTFDLNQSNLFITPNAVGGVDVSSVSPQAVPEPAMWSLMIAGFGLVGSAMRRRTAVAA